MPSAAAATVYGIAQASGVTSTSTLSDSRTYPYFSRTNVPSNGFVDVMKAGIVYYQSIQTGWDRVAVISTISEFSLTFASRFIQQASPEIEIVSYQQYLPDAEDLSIEFREIIHSKARLIIASVFGDWQTFIERADAAGLVSDEYVWFVTGTVVTFTFVAPSAETRGTLGINFLTPETPEKEQFMEYWNNADPNVYPYTGTDYQPTPLALRVFDMVIAVARAIDYLERQGLLDGQYVSPETWTAAIRRKEFAGASGNVAFDENGDRVGTYSILYYRPESGWEFSASWTKQGGYQYFNDVVWYSNTTEVPDLEIREPFNYWSCDEKKMRKDKTGKTVHLHSPGSSNVDEIESSYHCDHFIDCQNMSDESVDCTANYQIVFIVFGVVTGFLILLSVLSIMFVLLFGMIMKYRRLRQASPLFLIIISLSIILGFLSIYAWFGKPHPVSCVFQAWILGLSAISMIAALSVKNFRIWRVFHNPSQKVRITDLQLLGLWLLILIPAVVILILWSIISTPTAAFEERNDNQHYVCVTGGFSGPPGGIIFFSVFVAYSAFVLFIGALISFAVRKVPAAYNEATLLTISIYNLGFLSVVIIPVFLAINPFNPFVAWILRTAATLYAFTATLVLQFVPILFGVFILDKGKNVRTFKSNLKALSSSDTRAAIQTT